MHRLAAFGLVGDFLCANLALATAFSLGPNISFAGWVETAMLNALYVCEIPNTILDDLVGIGELAISLIINMVAN